MDHTGDGEQTNRPGGRGSRQSGPRGQDRRTISLCARLARHALDVSQQVNGVVQHLVEFQSLVINEPMVSLEDDRGLVR
jgi:hypothetical protein